MYRPYTKEDKLEVGTDFMIAGRAGKIVDLNRSAIFPHKVYFDGIKSVLFDIDLLWFPLLEIADKPVKPLTIDKRVKEEIFRIFKFKGFWRQTEESMSAEVIAYLNSLEET